MRSSHSSSSSSSSRAQLSSPSFFLLLSTLLLLVLTPTSSFARPRPHGPPVDHLNPIRARGLLSSSTTGGALSPRPTPEPAKGKLAHLMATFDSAALPDLLFKRAIGTACYGSTTTAAQINNYFATNGASAGVFMLCPGAVISVNQTILFTASNQGISTQGGTSVALTSRAKLNLVDASISTVLQATNCVNCNDLLISSLIIDGGRAALGALNNGGALIEIGGTSQRHTVTNCQIANTRGWSSLHFIEGTGLTCVGAVVTNNVIGPSGQSYGVGNIADGISLACRGSTVQGNTIFDATDGAIVVFGSPGSDVSGNTISSVNNVLLGGINMVDYAPWSGDYTDTLVHGNTITASGSQTKIGIAQGPAIWGDDLTNINFGAKVYSNSFGGAHMSFGLSVAGVKSWSTTENTVLSSARFQGAQTGNCHGIGGTVSPTFALYDPSKTDATLDLGDDANCWSQGTFQYLLCYVADTTTAGASPSSAFISGGTCTAAAPPVYGSSNWKSANLCLLDSAANRVLVGNFIQTDSNSIEYCTSLCTSLQYNYAGLENGNQCYCSNAIAQGTGYGTVRASSSCTVPCAANSAEICGGNDYGLGLYYDASRVAAPVIESSSSTVSSSTSASSTSSRMVTSVSSRSSSSASKTSTASSQASSTFSSASATPSSSALPSSNGYSSLGCVQDTSSYILQDYAFSSSAMTIDLCTSTCKAKSFPYAGLEYSSQCKCGNTIVSSGGGGASLASASCSMACSGVSTSKCGGYYTMSLYYSQALLSSVSASSRSVASATSTSSASVPSASGWSSGTCVSDDNARILTGISTSSASMTPAICQAFCSAYAYSGTEYSTQCYCGNSITATTSHGQASTNCNLSCGGDSSQKCGGSYAMTLYTKKPATWSTPTCVTDGGGGSRLLNAYYLEGSLMTNKLCQSTCKSKNYIYAATEYSNQCYCSNTLATSATVGKASTGCSYKCAGNSSQICGGSYAASLSTFS